MMQKTLYFVVGPTAVGKTAFAIQLANYLKTEIISAGNIYWIINIPKKISK
mgnify:CR=1 FL=1